jgi:capsule biosynthesis phosphatase
VRICIDLDGVICQLRRNGETYETVEPVTGAVDAIRQLRAAGHCIIVYTARHMKTCDGNVGEVLARQGRATFEWLARHEVEYDEIHFGKPHADVYIDDNAVRFESWQAIAPDGSTLPKSAEARVDSAHLDKTPAVPGGRSA